MPARITTPPTSEPIDLGEAKAHLRLDTALDDAYVQSLISAARLHVESYCRRGLVTQEWELVLSAFPCGESIELPFGQLAADTEEEDPVESVTYIDAEGVERTLATTEYVVDTVSVPGVLRLAYGKSWPATRQQWDAVRIAYTVGTAVDDVPQPIKQAMLLLISQMYEHRTPEITGTIVSQVQFATESLLGPYRLPQVG